MRTVETRDALRRARHAFAYAVPVTPREHVQQMLAVSLWLGDWAEELGAEALDDLSRRVEPIRKDVKR